MTTPTDIERLKALTIAIQSYQQADEEGVMVLVSRQACDETAAALRALPALLARIERGEGEPSAISLLERARDELVECAQDYHHQPKAMIAEINAYLAAAEQSLSSARAEIEGLKTERDEAQMELKRHFPVSKYNGLDIEQWKDRALAAERILALSGQHWRELWYGSEPQKGSWIYADREPVAFIGPDATAHALTTAIVIAHNAAIVSARAEGWKAGIEAAAKVARERAANIDDTIARTQVATHLAMQLSARLDEVSRLATTIESLGGINPRVDDAHEALLRDLARVERPADADDRPCDDTWEDANLLWDFADRARSALDEGRAPSGVASHKSRQEGEDDGG